MPIKFHKMEEQNRDPRRRLGRYIKHDPRSRDFPLSALIAADAKIKTAAWERHTAAFNQGDIGSCTGNAECGLLMTDPFYEPGRELSENDAVALYSLATHIDPVDGQTYPPDDTGSSGLDISRAAVQKGYISAYHHGFDLEEIQQYLSNNGPLILGMNWYSSFDQPNSEGIVQLSHDAQVRGGHEVEVFGINCERELIELWNSWGSDWGDSGKFYIPFEVFDVLLSEDGDLTASVK